LSDPRVRGLCLYTQSFFALTEDRVLAIVQYHCVQKRMLNQSSCVQFLIHKRRNPKQEVAANPIANFADQAKQHNRHIHEIRPLTAYMFCQFHPDSHRETHARQDRIALFVHR